MGASGVLEECKRSIPRALVETWLTRHAALASLRLSAPELEGIEHKGQAVSASGEQHKELAVFKQFQLKHE